MIKRLKTMWDDRENQARYMKWLMQYSKPYIGKIILVMLLGIASTVASLVMVQISKVIIDNASFGNAFVRLLVVYLLLMLLMQGISIVKYAGIYDVNGAFFVRHKKTDLRKDHSVTLDEYYKVSHGRFDDSADQ